MRKKKQLLIKSENIPVVQCGNGCKVNTNGAKLVEENLGVKSPFSLCASHAAHGKIMKSCMKIQISIIKNYTFFSKLVNFYFVIIIAFK